MKTETKRILEKAQAGDAEAQYLTGLYYEDKGNADEAFLWYDRSATQGFVYGINAVAIYYLKGMAVKHDTGKAIALLESIADKFPTAKANLGHIYLEGQGCPHAVAAAAPAAIGAFSENEKNFGKSLIFVALGEGVAIYGLLISILIINKI